MPHTRLNRELSPVDKNAVYPPAIKTLKADEALPKTAKIRQIEYLNNLVKQDHRLIKRRVNPGLGFGSFNTARRTLKRYESMNMIRKGQSTGADKGDVMGQISFINKIFGLAT